MEGHFVKVLSYLYFFSGITSYCEFIEMIFSLLNIIILMLIFTAWPVVSGLFFFDSPDAVGFTINAFLREHNINYSFSTSKLSKEKGNCISEFSSPFDNSSELNDDNVPINKKESNSSFWGKHKYAILGTSVFFLGVGIGIFIWFLDSNSASGILDAVKDNNIPTSEMSTKGATLLVEETSSEANKKEVVSFCKEIIEGIISAIIKDIGSNNSNNTESSVSSITIVGNDSSSQEDTTSEEKVNQGEDTGPPEVKSELDHLIESAANLSKEIDKLKNNILLVLEETKGEVTPELSEKIQKLKKLILQLERLNLQLWDIFCKNKAVFDVSLQEYYSYWVFALKFLEFRYAQIVHLLLESAISDSDRFGVINKLDNMFAKLADWGVLRILDLTPYLDPFLKNNLFNKTPKGLRINDYIYNELMKQIGIITPICDEGIWVIRVKLKEDEDIFHYLKIENLEGLLSHMFRIKKYTKRI